jgi:enoyl-CoA hydratase/carnithine racemase
MSDVLQSRRDGRLLHLTLNRPEKRNALNSTLCTDLTTALTEAQEDSNVAAVLLTGNGKGFSGGMDLFEAASADPGKIADLQERLFTAYAWLTKPLIVGTHGSALAGGTGLVANAHVAIAADDAVFGLTEIRVGLWPFVIFRAMAATIGERRSIELSLTGRLFGAAEALSYGLVHQVVPAAELPLRATEIAQAVANSSPAVLTAGLAFVRQSRAAGMDEVGRAARRYREQICAGEDFQERVRQFRAGRKP